MTRYGIENRSLRKKLASLQKKDAVPVGQWRALLAEAAALTEIPHVGVQIGSQVELKHVGVLGYLVANCDTLADALGTYLLSEQRFYGVNFARLTERNGAYTLAWPDKIGDENALFVQVALTSLVTFLRYRFPSTCQLVQVAFSGLQPEDPQAFEDYFRCQVTFDSSYPGITVDYVAANQREADPLQRGFRAIQNQQSDAFGRVIAVTNPFHQQLQAVLLKRIPEGRVSLSSVASEMGCAPRTLQRRLSEYHFSYQTLIDAVREQLGRRYLMDTSLTYFEIAMLLGFSEQSAFNRAFKLWTGKTPGAYRREGTG